MVAVGEADFCRFEFAGADPNVDICVVGTKAAVGQNRFTNSDRVTLLR
jgi:hypothetical protein